MGSAGRGTAAPGQAGAGRGRPGLRRWHRLGQALGTPVGRLRDVALGVALAALAIQLVAWGLAG